MDLKRLSVAIEADGFRIGDHHSGLEPDTWLVLGYELSSGWVSREIQFTPEPPTLLHPFRKSMFLYTGEPPLRVLIRLQGTKFSREFEGGVWQAQERQVFYDDNDFFSFPDFADSAWRGAGDPGPFFNPPPPEMPLQPSFDVDPGDAPGQRADDMAERRAGEPAADEAADAPGDGAAADNTMGAEVPSDSAPNAY